MFDLPPPTEGIDFFAEFRHEMDFGTNYDFGALFDADFGAMFSFDDDNLSRHSFGSYSYDDVSISFSDEGRGARRPRHRRRMRTRRRNRHFRAASVRTSCWYINYTRPGTTRDLTHELSSGDRFGEFRHWFRMPLSKVEALTDILIVQGYVKEPRTFFRRREFRERTELLVMSALYVLGHGAGFRSCRALCNISTSKVRKFFHLFLDALVAMQDNYISLPSDMAALRRVSRDYEENGLPGCVGSMDVVHVKWSSCPMGDHNRAKGKEGYPTLAFQCITDFNRRVQSVYGPHFGTRNDKDIVKHDIHVKKIQTDRLFTDTCWQFYAADGSICHEQGLYVVCDNGYLSWPTLICPFTQAREGTLEGYFSSNIEGVRKDVECTFGILKKRWRVLSHGFTYRDINICEKIFVTCCCLHNFLLDLMDRSTVRVGRGYPIGDDGMWLSGNSNNVDDSCDRELSIKFGMRRDKLAKHLKVFKEQGLARRIGTDESLF